MQLTRVSDHDTRYFIIQGVKTLTVNLKSNYSTFFIHFSGKVAKPRGRKSRVTSREEISSSSSENEFNSQNGSISGNVSESDPILDLIEESNLIENPSEILPDPLEVLPENAFENDSITEDNPSEYEMQRMENIADKNTFLKKSTKLLDTKVPPKIKRKTKLIIPTSEDSPHCPPVAKKSKAENSNSEPLKSRVMPKRRAATKSPMSYAENHEIEENPMDSDKSIELPSLPPALLAANPDLANISSGKYFMNITLLYFVSKYIMQIIISYKKFL